MLSFFSPMKVSTDADLCLAGLLDTAGHKKNAYSLISRNSHFGAALSVVVGVS